MKKTIIILVILLVVSNSWWVYKSIDKDVSVYYRDKQLHELEETRKQLMNMLPEISKNQKKEKIIEIATHYSKEEMFENDGCTWVGWIGFKFNKAGELESVSPAWSYGGQDPCFPLKNN